MRTRSEPLSWARCSVVSGEVAEAAGYLARPYDVSLRLKQPLRRGQVVSLRRGVAEYLLDIGGGEVGLADSVGLLVSWLALYGIGDSCARAIRLACRRREQALDLPDQRLRRDVVRGAMAAGRLQRGQGLRAPPAPREQPGIQPGDRR
jgi:hypothetical protein